MNFINRNYEEYVPLNDISSFDFSPPNLDHNIEFNLTSATFSTLQYSYDIDIDSGTLQFRCGFRIGNNHHVFITPSTVILNIKKGIIYYNIIASIKCLIFRSDHFEELH